NAQGFQSSQGEIIPVFGSLSRQPEIRATLPQRAESYLSFQPRERRAETEMRSSSKRDVLVIGAAHIETVRFRKMGRIAVCGAEYEIDPFALTDFGAIHLLIGLRQTRGQLHRSVVAEHLL